MLFDVALLHQGAHDAAGRALVEEQALGQRTEAQRAVLDQRLEGIALRHRDVVAADAIAIAELVDTHEICDGGLQGPGVAVEGGGRTGGDGSGHIVASDNHIRLDAALSSACWTQPNPQWRASAAARPGAARRTAAAGAAPAARTSGRLDVGVANAAGVSARGRRPAAATDAGGADVEVVSTGDVRVDSGFDMAVSSAAGRVQSRASLLKTAAASMDASVAVSDAHGPEPHVPAVAAGAGPPHPSGSRRWKSDTPPRTSTAMAQHVTSIWRSWSRPRCTRDFMPEIEMPAWRAASACVTPCSDVRVIAVR